MAARKKKPLARKKKAAAKKKPAKKPVVDSLDHNYLQERFCQEYAGGEFMGNATRSYLAAGYECSESSAKTASNRLLTNVVIKKRIAGLQSLRLSRLKITGDSIIETVRSIADNPEAQDKDRLKASELLMKQQGMLTEKHEVTVTELSPYQEALKRAASDG